MAPSGAKYPQHLNPFGDEDEEEVNNKIVSNPKALTSDEYPADLDPFGEDGPHVEDYDDSLNPFGDETTASDVKRQNDSELVDEEASSNPFADDIEKELDKQLNNEKTNANVNLQSDIATNFDSLEPPKPLPRTKSLLKKEQHRRRLQELQQQTENTNIEENTPQSASTSDLQVDVKNLSSETIDGNKTISLGTSQARKQKRLAPPVPVNFKRQVIGSLDAIEEELNDIGDKLAIIDKESAICQEILVAPNEDINPDTTRSKFIELIKRRNTFVRRQKELMYTKRELKLDQLHSDIEYELRMIGNKQLSTRTKEDESKEKELLKKLVEIVEEKNDIVENLNKDTCCDSVDIEEAFKRLNIKNNVAEKSKDQPVDNGTLKVGSKNDSCDKRSLARLSKIATLLPRGNAIKLKRKKLFKKNCDPKQIDQ